MTVTTTITNRGVIGSRKFITGTYSADDTGGDIETGLNVVEFISVQAGGSSVVADAPTVNETLPLANGGDVTIIVTNATAGFWYAIGK